METKESVLTPEDRALLEELLLSQKRELRHARIGTVASLLLAAALLITLMILVPKAVAVMGSIETTIAQVEESLQDVDVLVDNANTLVEENLQGITVAVARISELDFDSLNDSVGELNSVSHKLNAVDFDALNQDIQNLSEVIEPLARFANMFR